MKLAILFACVFMISCSSKEKVIEAPVAVAKPSIDTVENYFPVTNYILGQIAEIRTNGLNPLMIVQENNKIDSTWLPVETFNQHFAPFLYPVIDTANFKSLYKETKFEDQSINAYTWSYEPYSTLPDTLNLKRWDIYVSTETSKVTRVYWVKEIGKDAQQQLTWNSGSSCKIVDVRHANGKTIVDKEVNIKWYFNE